MLQIALILAVVGLLVVGLFFSSRGLWLRRIGDEPRCRRCEYNLSAIQSVHCPECGSELAVNGIVHGERKRKYGLIFSGIAILFAAGLLVAAIVVGQVREIKWYSYLPTSWMLEDLKRGQYGSAMDAYWELKGKLRANELSPEHRNEFIRIALEMQSQKPTPPITEALEVMLLSELVDNRLTEEERDKFFRQGIPFELMLPKLAAHGEPVFYQVTGPVTVLKMVVWKFRITDIRYRIDGAETVHYRNDEAGSAGSIGTGADFYRSLPAMNSGRHSLDLEFRFEIWNDNVKLWLEDVHIAGEFEVAESTEEPSIP